LKIVKVIDLAQRRFFGDMV